ncbi:DUF3103 family protein [Streptomyces sp. RKAG290]|uniref:DUF3103 family protein n=1 Tax=Streptomyces sp. RKAG290 TaxID=2888348 RepID=UPI0025522759|nr:DUF3103 family protein [Streptomyces sp. RKAG290]
MAALCVVAVSAVTLSVFPASASPSADPSKPAPARTAAPSDSVGAIKDRAAQSIAAALKGTGWRAGLSTAALAAPEVGLRELLTAPTLGSPALRQEVNKADRDLARAKGLSGHTTGLLQIRLGDPSMRAALRASAQPWVAAAPDDDTAGQLVAYDPQGGVHKLDAEKVPTHPVYVIDIDGERAVSAGMQVLSDELSARGVLTTSAKPTRTAAPGFWSSRIKSVRLTDDEEPWTKGDAEIYSLVAGFGQDGKVRVDPVDMPYLDEDEKTYSPNQILVNWSNYKYDLADVVMMEEDGSTNYKALATAIADALLTIVDLGAFVPMANAVLGAIPDDWWTDGPDYVESWYTLARSASGPANGARGNGTMTLEPYWVAAS